MINPYITATQGIMTASKLKDFIKSPELYYVKYEKMVELEEEDKRHFVVGTAFDYLLSNGNQSFLEQYYVDDGYLVDELKGYLVARGMDKDEVSKMKLPQLRALYYDNEKDSKIRLTPSEGRDIMGMYREVMRQPMCDMADTGYSIQHRVEADYKGIKVGGTLDRYHKDKALIRDRKTAGRIDRFHYDIENTFDYILSMSFYFLLVYLNDKIECDVILDVLGKTSPYAYIPYRLDKKILLQKLKDTIKPALDYYVECKQKNERPSINPITRHPIDRMTLIDNPYYGHLDSTLVGEGEYIDPRDMV